MSLAATLLLVATLAPTALANHDTNGLDPVIDTPEVWRGWVAHEYEDLSETTHGEGHIVVSTVNRMWWVDGSATADSVRWHLDHYKYVDNEVGWCGRSEGAASGEGADADHARPSLSEDLARPTGNFLLPYPDQTEGLFFVGAFRGEDHAQGPNLTISCDGSRHEGTLSHYPHWSDAVGGADLDLSEVPTMVSERKSWVDGSAERSYQVCMTRSTTDTDGDLLPDDVDLDPSNAAPLTDLGIPGGPPYEVIPAKLKDGPSGKRGVPECPGAHPEEPSVPELNAVDDEWTISYRPGIDEPRETFPVLANDDGDGLEITALSAPTGGGTVSEQGGMVGYTPPSGDFVGAVEFTYTVSDGTGASDTATVRLLYRTCRIHELTVGGKGPDGDENEKLKGKLQMCGDGVNPPTSKVTYIDTKVRYRYVVFAGAVARLVRLVTLGKVSFDMSLDWRSVSGKGDPMLKGYLKECDTIRVAAGFALSRKKQKQLQKKLEDILGSESWAKKIVSEIMKTREVLRTCDTWLGFKTSTVGDDAGYSIEIDTTFDGAWSGGQNLFLRIDGSERSIRALPEAESFRLECTYLDDAATGEPGGPGSSICSLLPEQPF